MSTPLSIAATAAHLAIERIRHPIQARHLQVVRRIQVSPGFVRLTLAGPELAGFASAGFDDHLKLILPQAGQERPSLPIVQDGRPVFSGPRPVLRDYTPARFDAAAGELDIEVALHEAGPASDWAAAAFVGQWVGIAGPRGSLVIPTGFDWHWLIGDETALPAISRRLAELPAHTRATVRIQVQNPADRRALPSAAQLDLQWVPALPAAVVTQPVASTIISFLISAFMSPTLAESCLILGLLQPTTPTKPRTVPAFTASSRGSSVPPNASRMASFEKPVMMLTGSTGISTRLGSRSTKASTAMRTILRASSRAFSG